MPTPNYLAIFWLISIYPAAENGFTGVDVVGVGVVAVVGAVVVAVTGIAPRPN